MPTYDFRCKMCGTEFAKFYKSVASYNRASPACPECESPSLDRVINRVSFAAMGRDYAGMSSNEMLSVLESGDSQQVRELYHQVGGTSPDGALAPHQQMQQIERDNAPKTKATD